MTKLRLSNHKLEIEAGRYKRPPIKSEERQCTHCPGKIEDEEHFLLECKNYDKKRKDLFKELEKEMKIDFKKMTRTNTFLLLMGGGKNKNSQKAIAKYISECFTLRAGLLSIQ